MSLGSLVRSRISKSLAALALLVGFGGASVQAQAAPATPARDSAAARPLATREQALEVGRAVAVAAYAGKVDDLFALADSSATASPDIRARLVDGVGQIAMQLGAERRMISEQVMKVDGVIEYWRTAEYEQVPIPLVFRVYMGKPGKWRGFTATPENQLPVGEVVP